MAPLKAKVFGILQENVQYQTTDYKTRMLPKGQLVEVTIDPDSRRTVLGRHRSYWIRAVSDNRQGCPLEGYIKYKLV